MSDIETGITTAKKIEAALEKQYRATGKGLHEKVSSIEKQLSPSLVRKIRFIATIRNKLAHDSNYKRIDDKSRFKRTAKEILQELNPPLFTGKAIAIFLLIDAVLIACYFAIRYLK